MVEVSNSSSSPSLAADLILHLSAYPPWSLAAHLAVAGLVVSIQQAVKESKQFAAANEFLCTLLWVCWTLESSVIGFASSSRHVLFTLFIRLLLCPFLFHDACVNPCNSVYMAVEQRSARKIPQHLVMQFMAMAAGLLYSILSWQFLGSWLSDVHLSFMGSHTNPFLNVTLLEGFLLELGMAFAMYIPRMVMKIGFTCNFVSAAWTCVMIILLEHTTGAFMNPLIATSSTLLWHFRSFGMGDLAVLLVVYWLGPVLGTVLAARLDLWAGSRRRRKVHSS